MSRLLMESSLESPLRSVSLESSPRVFLTVSLQFFTFSLSLSFLPTFSSPVSSPITLLFIQLFLTLTGCGGHKRLGKFVFYRLTLLFQQCRGFFFKVKIQIKSFFSCFSKRSGCRGQGRNDLVANITQDYMAPALSISVPLYFFLDNCSINF